MIRRGRPGLLGTAARTAVIAGTATATANAVSNRQMRKQQAAQQQAAQEQQAAQQQAAPQQATPAATEPTEDLIEQLQKLASLKEAGVLSDAEFAAAKAKLLGT